MPRGEEFRRPRNGYEESAMHSSAWKGVAHAAVLARDSF
jgi:hypothetical protein